VDGDREYQLTDYKKNVTPNDSLFELTKHCINHTRAKGCWDYTLLASDYRLHRKDSDRPKQTDRQSLLKNTEDPPRTTWQIEAQCEAIIRTYWPNVTLSYIGIDYFRPSKSLRYIHWASVKNIKISYSGVEFGLKPALKLNLILLDSTVPDFVVGFVLYHELLHFFTQNFAHKHTSEFVSKLYDYNWCWDAELWMCDNLAHVLLLQETLCKQKARTKND